MTTCERFAEQDSAERYVAGRMTAEESAEFEQHFLACDACLQTVRGIEDVRDVLAERRAALERGAADPLAAPGVAVAAGSPVGSLAGSPAAQAWSRKSRAWSTATWLAAAAALIAAIGWMLGVGLSRLASPGSSSAPVSAVARNGASAPAASQAPPTSSAAASGQAGQPGPNQTPPANASSQQPPSGTPAGTPAQSPGTPSGSGPTAFIARLAIVIPPPYVAVPVRGEGDGAQKAFAAAMTRYRAGDHAGAAAGLRALVEKTPDLVAAQFYLGICELMTRQTRRAETALKAAADSDVTPYADEAYFYLAKAALQRGDLTAAERALTEAVAREAGPGNEARRLLEEVRGLGRSE